MNDETKDTVEILSRIAYRNGRDSFRDRKWLVIIGDNVGVIGIVRDRDKFYMDNKSSIPARRYSGFELLEHLAQWPLFAKQLAEPHDG